jgi:hypothetical protein
VRSAREKGETTITSIELEVSHGPPRSAPRARACCLPVSLNCGSGSIGSQQQRQVKITDLRWRRNSYMSLRDNLHYIRGELKKNILYNEREWALYSLCACRMMKRDFLAPTNPGALVLNDSCGFIKGSRTLAIHCMQQGLFLLEQKIEQMSRIQDFRNN